VIRNRSGLSSSRLAVGFPLDRLVAPKDSDGSRLAVRKLI
jgi:hypothetical protein